MDSLKGIWAKIKEHPYLVAGAGLVGLILIFVLFSSGSATPASGADSAAADEASIYGDQTQAASQLAQDQLAEQAQTQNSQDQLAAINAQASEQESIANTQASTTLGVSQLQLQGIQSTNDDQLSAIEAQTAAALSATENTNSTNLGITNSNNAAELGINANNNATSLGITASNNATMLGIDQGQFAEETNATNQAANSANLATTLEAGVAQSSISAATQQNAQDQATEQALISAQDNEANINGVLLAIGK